MTKADILTELLEVFQTDLALYNSDLLALQDDLANDTKSSAGDKFETAREMAQQEIAKIQHQMQLTSQTILLIQRAFESNEHEFGRLIKTSVGLFLLGIPFKRLTLSQNTPIMGIGFNAPLAKEFSNSELGKQISTPNGSIKILDNIH